MYPVSAQFLDSLTTDHGMVVQVDLMYDGVVTREDIPITGGSVSVDAESEVRRSLSLTVPDPSVFPTLVTDPYSVYGQEVFVRRGVRLPSGEVELIPLGFFVITDIEGDVHTGPLKITGAGREFLVQCQPFETATSTGLATSPAAFIETQLNATVPGASFVDESTDGTTGLAHTTWDVNEDRWDALQEVALSVGCELFVDANGTFVLRDAPIASPPFPAPVWEVAAGENGVMVGAEKSLSIKDVYNRVYVYGENTSEGEPPIRSNAMLSDPNNPLRWNGPLGRRVRVYTSNLITSYSQAGGVANSLLRRYSAPNRTVEVTTIPNPALDAGDCIRVAYGNGNPPELFIVRSFDISLSLDGQPCTIETVSGRDDE